MSDIADCICGGDKIYVEKSMYGKWVCSVQCVGECRTIWCCIGKDRAYIVDVWNEVMSKPNPMDWRPELRKDPWFRKSVKRHLRAVNIRNSATNDAELTG